MIYSVHRNRGAMKSKTAQGNRGRGCLAKLKKELQGEEKGPMREVSRARGKKKRQSQQEREVTKDR